MNIYRVNPWLVVRRSRSGQSRVCISAGCTPAFTLPLNLPWGFHRIYLRGSPG